METLKVINKPKCFYPEVNGEITFICYYPNFLESEHRKELLEWLEIKEYREGKCISGKEIPRLQLWYQEDEKYFCEKWKYRYDRWKSEKYDNFLRNLQEKVNVKTNELLEEYCPKIYKPKINSCLINKYRSGCDSIKPHRDTPVSFGEYPTIVGLSIGDKRKIIFRKIDFNKKNYNSMKTDKSSPIELEIELEDNSLFIMGGASQKYFSHEIPKTNSDKERYSLTLREFMI